MGNITPVGNNSIFEKARKFDDAGREYWLAREFQDILQYASWQKFSSVIDKAKEACRNTGHKLPDHFIRLDKMVSIGSAAQREIDDIKLSRYACYLIIQNADPAKEIVALGQTYFAVQTRKQELLEKPEFKNLAEKEKRLFLRKEMTQHNKQLADAARNAGVIQPLDYAIFQDHGYKGLYGGLGAKDIHARKGLKKSQQILDHMGSTELAANLFRATQTEEKLRRENIKGKTKANIIHYEVGKKVRKTIAELGGTMPEKLPAAESIKKQVKKLKPK
ncbi:MAG: DNA damage-inducible protein D [Candidatus Margulisbacteria bacterium]|jgi:DNA-damage-inducible protein D|nr:DNA damage-inducible protein D [Candidatus Margulisiibacteriota bacterium]